MTEFWKATFNRAIRTVCQVLSSTVPAGLAITPTMIETFNIGYVYVILGWLGTGLLGGLLSIITSIATGLPEVDPAIEYTDEDIENVKVEPYDTENYDDLYIDDEVEDGEVEQEE